MLAKDQKKLKILFFSQRFPLPMDAGGKIRTGPNAQVSQRDI